MTGKLILMTFVGAFAVSALEAEVIASDNAQADDARKLAGLAGTVSVRPDRILRTVKPMNAVNNGPQCPNPYSDSQYLTNGKTYRMARIPFARTHDSSICYNYGGEHTVDISAVFPDFSRDENDPASYDFAVTDYYLENIRRAGTEPYFRLGQKIEHGIRKYGVMPPPDLGKWARVCDHVVRHYNEGWANGFRWNIRHWEIWNEPDLDTSWRSTEKSPVDVAPAHPRTWGGTEAQFFDLFEATAKLLKRNHPDILVGGPAVGWRKDWVERFLREMSRRSTPLDFFSWHIYTAWPEKVPELAVTYRTMLDRFGYAQTLSHCNEWNITHNWQGGFVRTLTEIGSVANAAAALGTMILSQNAPVDMLMYYDARPDTGFNGLWDAHLRPLKGYWAFYAWGRLAALGHQLEVTTEGLPKGWHVIAATDDSRTRGGLVVARYHSAKEDEYWTGPRKVRLRAPGVDLTKARCHLTDETFSYSEFELDFVGQDAILLLEPQSFAVIEWGCGN